MKKRVFSVLLALALALSAIVLPASAAEGFSDVTDKKTAQNVEILRLLGVIDGNGLGQFRPGDPLTRAEFCKMVVTLSGNGESAASYRTMTIFPDVRASHWASGYINLSVRQLKLLSGQPDGTFQPDRAITYGEAVTILMRLLGYSNADSGGVWPDGFINLAKAQGVGAGLTLSGSAAISRAQAAQLFVNVLSATGKEGATYTPSNCKLDSAEVTIISFNGSTVRVSGADKSTFDLARPGSSSALNGLKGHFLIDKNNKVATFVPLTDTTTGTAVSNAAVIIGEDKSASGISALTGGRTDYTVYRNGSRTGISGLRQYDVVTYDVSTNTVYACDTRVKVYYESCSPSRTEAATITVLGGTVFPVLPTAQGSLAKFKPGEVMTILLTADGAVAGAVAGEGTSARSNAVGFVSGSGRVEMFCGSTTIPLNGTADASCYHKVVSISSSTASGANFHVQTGGASGSLNVREKTLGSRQLSDNVMIYDNGVLKSLSELTEAVIPQSGISYARTNSSGQIDLIVLDSAAGTEKYGRATVSTTRNEWTWKDGYGELAERNTTNSEWKVDADYEAGGYWVWKPGYGPDTIKVPGQNGNYSTSTTISVDCKGVVYKFESGYVVDNGDFVAFTVNQTGDGFSSMSRLTKFSSVPKTAWIGTTAVMYGGMTYTVPESTPCWNRDSETWFTTVEDAVEYGGTMSLYVKDDMICAIEVRS